MIIYFTAIPLSAVLYLCKRHHSSMRSHIFKKAGEHLLSSTIQLFSSSAKFYSTSSCFLSTPGPQIPHNATWKGCLEILPCAGRSQLSLELLVQSSDLVSSAFFKSTFPDSALTQVTSPREINQFALFILEPHRFVHTNLFGNIALQSPGQRSLLSWPKRWLLVILGFQDGKDVTHQSQMAINRFCLNASSIIADL